MLTSAYEHPNTMQIGKQSCKAICLADRLDFSSLKEQLGDINEYTVYKSVIEIKQKNCIAYIFNYGVIVFWNPDPASEKLITQTVLGCAENPLTEPEEDSLTYTWGLSQERIHQDHIELKTQDHLTLLALSHSLAQSVKLSYFEGQALNTIKATYHIPATLALKGKTQLSRRKIAKIRGQLFLTKSDIILNYDLLDTPDFFWEYPEHEPVYTLGTNYLELKARTEVLSKKLETIHELFQMLADEQKHQHSSILEWIIIWLIAIEIVIFTFHELFQ